jgi:hypothetical protein
MESHDMHKLYENLLKSIADPFSSSRMKGHTSLPSAVRSGACMMMHTCERAQHP